MPGWLWMCCVAVSGMVMMVTVERREVQVFQPTYFIPDLFSVASEKKQTYGVVVIALHVRGGCVCAWVVAVGRYFLHHVVATLHRCTRERVGREQSQATTPLLIRV